MIPYGRQSIEDDDIEAVVRCLKSPWLTTGPEVASFEDEFKAFVGSKFAVAVNSGTAALHCAYYAAGIGPGDEVIVPTVTFAATANAAVFLGATPVFCDVQPGTLLIDPLKVEALVSPKTKAIVAVDYAGQPCDYDALRAIADRQGLALIADSCHSIGATYKGRSIGSVADLTAFSFHPVKHLTTGEGGMITTHSERYNAKMRQFRNHGITSDHRERETKNTWRYEMVDIGFNYRLTDIQCALGRTQLRKQKKWLLKRREIAKKYDEFFKSNKQLTPLVLTAHVEHAYHLYVVKCSRLVGENSRDDLFQKLRAEGIGVNVHYIPVHLHPFYKNQFKTKEGMCPVAEEECQKILSLPMYPTITDNEISTIQATIGKVIG